MLEQFKKGDLVNFIYKNSCNETIHAYGTIERYEGRFYYVSIGDDMPLIRVYCNKVSRRTKSGEFIMPNKVSKTALIKDKEVLSIPLYYNELERILRQLRFITLGIGLVGCMLAVIMTLLK